MLLVLLFISSLAAQPPTVKCQANTTDEKIKLIKIPKDTVVEVELLHDVSSASTQKGDIIGFRAVGVLKIDGLVVVDSGARGTAVVAKAKRRRHWGRGGQLAFEMRNIVAVDGTRIPLRFTRQVTGDGNVATVTSAIVATGVLLWPIAPVSLLWGLKKGEDVVIPAGRSFEAVTSSDVTVKVVN
jgi:hypothetical protein